MIDWFEKIAASPMLADDAADNLQRHGFVVLPRIIRDAQLRRLTLAYDAEMAAASGPDTKIGSTSTRVNDFVNRGADFDRVYVIPELLDAGARVIKQPFKLSSLHARTVRPYTPAQELHVDVERDCRDWPLLGFILMIDNFRPDNGATRFVPGSHRCSMKLQDAGRDDGDCLKNQVLACGPAGSLLVFNGSTWHGHTANTSPLPRRSLQGAFIPRDGQAATNFDARMQPATRARLGELALHLLAT